MVTVVGVRFKRAGKVYYFDPDSHAVEKGHSAIVETARGIEFGDVVVGPKQVRDDEIVPPLKKVIRVATDEDKSIHTENKIKADEALEICQEKIVRHELDMKLIDVEYTFDNNKVIFYFTADGRVDFRELVKDLASVFRTRIELRQIGVRDEAKMLNGIGPCGVGLCCANWLGDFAPVSIKMAKDQNLSLNPTKISGICGRLMCCLRYEHENYVQIRKELPRKNDRIMTPEGKAVVIDPVILKESVKVRLILNEEKNELGEDVLLIHKDDIKPVPKCDKKGGGCGGHHKKEKPKQDDVEYKNSDLVAESDGKEDSKSKPDSKPTSKPSSKPAPKTDANKNRTDRSKRPDRPRGNNPRDRKPRENKGPRKPHHSDVNQNAFNKKAEGAKAEQKPQAAKQTPKPVAQAETKVENKPASKPEDK